MRRTRQIGSSNDTAYRDHRPHRLSRTRCRNMDSSGKSVRERNKTDGNGNELVDGEADVRVLPLIGGEETTLADALEEEENMLVRLAYPRQRFDFFVWVQTHRDELATLVGHNLGMRPGEACELSQPREWKHGSFNLCIPIYTHHWEKHIGKRVLLRLPLCYKTGELQNPGNTDEKLRTETATHIWVQQNCPDVHIPHLWAFAFPGGRTRVLSFFTGRSTHHRYVSVERTIALEHGYLIMDYLEHKDGMMLSESWSEDRKSPELRQNLFRGLACIMLSLSRVPLPRIGSWTIDDQGKLSLTNRPLLHQLHSLENEGIPTNMSRTRTYDTTDAFYADLLACHDSRVVHQPNSVMSEEDGQLQLACLFAMRGLARSFTNPDIRHGPFAFSLTDLHASNIFVDEQWNINYIIDLEWACSLPLEMQSPPYWLTDRGVDQLHQKADLEEFDELRQEFMRVFEDEERAQEPLRDQMNFRTNLMNEGWQSGRFWYLHALLTTKGCYNLFTRNIKPMFTSDVEMDDLSRYITPFWCRSASDVVEAKLVDKENYEKQMREVFAKPCEDDG
nr:hypothetical protein CFP56_77645 [Quercus suber]